MSIFVRELAQADVPAQATAGTAQTTPLGEVSAASTVTEATLIFSGAITADATNNRIFTLQNRGAAGSGTVVVATVTTNVAQGNIAADDEVVMTLTATVADRILAAGDVLALVETVGGTGVAHAAAECRVRGTYN